ncbi:MULTISPECIES: protein-glutamate O-methyltransferase CheR [unclassified Chelatococcus]|uniref:CheR family methyltransferase n=1 Tax=unclassified Chelatococcus TaxID=2638111 RepID=UPI001BD027AE|nr:MULTISPECIES: protein-glutamate O-methyltransferase CheR [unclassified Chelatococcus]CAH1660562.1 Chemotaxis protein methyltransferase CheR [Hyphomicrobiales bacterium]MBS7741131.1 protein-glutamate O-methyltransferase CheR [Chelatococcus sp. HY11]MBX3545317.1 protein-glutamate O-methyltransferase CheR [Chelatococcus sp.]MCO5077950.1 protein-glutamate O-methyltransferase CheR [Chelatococcus sp.]CAH1683386.1 Chemotaxis protein methyltransferase CheR [Hyphomicrobiales bacterium]
MTEADYQFLSSFLRARSGMVLNSDGHYLARSRLPAVCRRFGLVDPAEVVAILRNGSHPEIEAAVVEAMVIQETFFFRDKTLFAQIHETVLPRLVEARASSRRLRIWSAAASTGQEAYSIAMMLAGLAPRLEGWTVDIVATDLSEVALERGRKGLYTHFEVQRGLPIQMLLKHFTQLGDLWQINADLTAMVDFSRINLLDDFSDLGTFDLILCRNVLMYLDDRTKRDVLERAVARLANDGKLILGGVETPLGLTEGIVADAALKGIYGRAGCR